MITLDNCSERELSEFDVVKQAKMRITRNFLDYLILSILRKNGNLSGNEITELIQSKVDVSPDCGVTCSSLYLLELKELINSEWINGKKTYRLTNQGEQTLELIIKTKEQIVNFTRLVLDCC